MRAAAEAVVELFRAHRERRRLLAGTGTTQEVSARFLQLDVAAHDIDDVDARQQIWMKLWGSRGQCSAPWGALRCSGASQAPRAAPSPAPTPRRGRCRAAAASSTPITLPICCGPVALVAAMAASISAATSAALACCGRRTGPRPELRGRPGPGGPPSRTARSSRAALIRRSTIADLPASSTVMCLPTSFCLIAANSIRIADRRSACGRASRPSCPRRSALSGSSRASEKVALKGRGPPQIPGGLGWRPTTGRGWVMPDRRQYIFFGSIWLRDA